MHERVSLSSEKIIFFLSVGVLRRIRWVFTVIVCKESEGRVYYLVFSVKI